MKYGMSAIRLVLAALIAALFSHSMQAARKGTAPDFAFPLKVEASAKKDLKHAVEASDGPMIVNSLIRMGLAKGAVSSDSLPEVLTMVRTTAEKPGIPADARAMLRLLEARIYTEIYQADSYRYRQRAVAETDYQSEDYTLWNRQIFLDRISQLIGEAVADRDALISTPIGEYAACIDYDRASTTFYPTLYDFVATRAIDCLQPFVDYGRTLSASLASDPLDQSLYPVSESNPTGRILGLYRSMIRGRELAAPGIHERREMLSFILPHVFRADSQDNMLPAFLCKPDTFDYDAWMTAFRSCSQSDYAIELLFPAADVAGNDSRKELYDIFTSFLASAPEYFNINAVKNRIADLSRGNVEVDYPSQMAKGRPTKVSVSMRNVNSATLKLYRIPDTVSADQWQRIPAGNPMATYTVEAEGTIPFASTQTAEITLPEFGRYIIVPEFKRMESPRGRTYATVVCSDIAAGAFGHTDGCTATVVDFLSGASLEGATLTLYPWRRNSAPTVMKGTTDADGFLSFASDLHGNIGASKGDDRFGIRFSVYPFGMRDTSTTYQAEFQTALALYRPGDTVDFSAILTVKKGNGKSRLASDRSLTVELYDANGQKADTQTLTTDAWGRAAGSFKLPSAGVTGNFGLRARIGDTYIGWRGVMVSDYKLPTFTVSIDSVIRPATPTDAARIYGTATTFAGFPVGDSNVSATVKVRTGFWFWSATSPVFYEAKGKTDATGRFCIEISADAIASSPAPSGYFLADVTVSSPDGETRQVSTGFNMGKPEVIQISVPEVFTVGESKADVRMLDFNGRPDRKDSHYTIYRLEGQGESNGTKVAEGAVPADGALTEVLGALPQGRYVVTVAPDDSSLADLAWSSPFVVYNPDETESPVAELLWLPTETVTADADGNVSFRFAIGGGNANVLAAISDSDGGLIEKRWLRNVAGQHTFNFRMPYSEKTYRIYLRSVRNGESASVSLTVYPYKSKEKLQITFETFRNKVLPLGNETITLRVKGVDGADPRSAVILDMSNRAIDVLAPNALTFNVPSAYFRGLNVDGLSFGRESSGAAQAYTYLETADMQSPAFNMYGRSFMMRRFKNLMIRGARPAVTMGAKAPMMDAVEEAADEVAVESVQESKQYASADAGASIETEKGSGTTTEEKTPEVSYRPSEIPLAFFRPMLATDADGSLKVEYTVPDANTTWIIRALAYNASLLSATADAEVVASRPLMVSLNAPRFLRTADRVVLLASVMNASDSTLTADSEIQILNAADNTVLTETTVSTVIEAGSRGVVALPFEVPVGVNGLVCRVRSVSGLYSDGEQTLVPVLPSDQDVVESQMFYLAPGQEHFSMTIAGVGPQGRAYLDFTENPVWTVVSALPGLRTNDIDSSIEAAASLFSAAVADGLMKRYPEIARALRRWSTNPNDSALVSQLEKNDQLKAILLNDTPWVGQALSQTQRMQRLVLLLDNKNTSAVIADAIDRLGRCFTSEGAWCWTPRYPEPSRWATDMILDMLGSLNRLQMLPADDKLSQMAESAIRWTDRQAVKAYAESPKQDFTEYAYLRSLWTDVKPSSAAAKVIRAQVNRILSGWSDHSVVLKGADALILNANGYHASARRILESLRQYATRTPERGMWWQQLENEWFLSLDKVGCTGILLDAFATIEPGCADVDAIRQWLVLEKMNTDWGNHIITSQVIASILASGSEWTIAPRQTAIHIGDTLVESENSESYTGSFVEPITSLVTRGTELTIDRQANYPSVGAVVSMRRLPMDSIMAVGCTDLSITKQLAVMRDGLWIASDRFNRGDRVRVTLTVRADADMDYVVISDARAATFEPVDQLPTPVWSENLCFYRENRDSATNLFISRLPRGVYVLAYELFATQEGTFASGVAQAQSQYRPAIAAHSGGAVVEVAPQ